MENIFSTERHQSDSVVFLSILMNYLYYIVYLAMLINITLYQWAFTIEKASFSKESM